MKRLLIPILITFSTLGFANIGEDVVTGSCKLTLSGNDYTGHKTLKSLKESIHVEDILARPGANFRIKKYFHQVIPFANNPDQFQKYQVAMFRSDNEALAQLSSEGVPYSLDKIRGQYNISIKYSGKPEKQIAIQVMSKFAETKETQVFKFLNTKELKINFKSSVKFPYLDYGNDGFIGGIVDTFDGDLTAEDQEGAKEKIHKSSVSVKCKLNINAEDSSVDDDREELEEMDEDRPFINPYAGRIIMPTGAVEN